MKSHLKVRMPDFPARPVDGQTASLSAPAPLAHLFLFVVIGCTNLAGSMSAASFPVRQPLGLAGVRSALNPDVSPQRLHAEGSAGITLEGGGRTTQPAVIPIAKISSSMTNQEVNIEATISNIRTPASERAPYVVTLDQDGATIPLVFWSDFLPALASKVKTGNLIRARVKISDYRGRLQLRLPSAADLVVVGTTAPTTSESATPAAAPPRLPVAATNATTVPRAKTAIGEIKGDWIDRVVTISGTIASSDNIGSGQKLHVQDGTGDIQVILWENVLGGLSASEFRPGRVIAVTGPVKRYRGRIEIVPDKVGNVKLTAQ
jgi:DNA/RNA endonuclease YhcR with UshA esterase domain